MTYVSTDTSKEEDIAVRIDPNAYVLVKNQAVKEDRTIKAVVKLAIEAYVKKNKK